MKACTLLFLVFINIAGYSQVSISSYKYVIVPQRFDFLRDDDQYGLNSATKRFLENKGFVVFMSNEKLPVEVAGNNCNALRAEITQRKALFTTNLTLALKDCQGNAVFKGKEGKSREKEFQVAYDEALNEALKSLAAVPYHYDSSLLTQPAQTTVTTGNTAPVPTPAPPPPPAPAPVEITGTLYAQGTPNGYQLIDTTPKKVLSLFKTSQPDFYIAISPGSSNGVVFKKDGQWIFEHYENDKLISQKLEIKF